MPTGFPTTSIDSYTTKANNIDTVAAADMNNLQDAVVAIETALGVPTYRGSALQTWTPTISFATAPTGGSIAYTTQTGHYARFGGIVWFNGFIVLSSIGTGGGGNASIGGLPVTSATSGLFFYHPCISTVSNWTSPFPTHLRVNNNATTMGIFQGTTTAALSAVTYSSFTNTSSVSFTGWYFHA
jgi:hypothetical protein